MSTASSHRSLEALLELEPGTPLRQGPLAIVPLFSPRVPRPLALVPLEKALRARTARITEHATAAVPSLNLEVGGEAPVVVIEGEVLLGGRQDRIVNSSLVVNSGKSVAIPVSCVERGRWTERTAAFRTSRALGAPVLRSQRVATGQLDQAQVWARVDEQLRGVGVTGTTSFEAVARTRKAELDALLAPFAKSFLRARTTSLPARGGSRARRPPGSHSPSTRCYRLSMLLCLVCGRVDDHDERCPRDPTPVIPAERAKRVHRALEEAQVILNEAAASRATTPRLAVLRLLSAEALLERHPSKLVSAFDVKRAHNDLATRISKERAALVSELGAKTATLVDDALFAKRAIELLWVLSLRRHEATSIDASSLSSVGISVAPDAPLGDVLREIERRLEETRALDRDVGEWGWDNLRRLTTGREPANVPPAIARRGTGIFGSLFRSAASRKAELATRFSDLGRAFRERLYLLGANTILQSLTSRLAQASEAWKKHLAKDDGAARWERLKGDARDVIAYFVDDATVDLSRGIEEAVAGLAREHGGVRAKALRPFDELVPDEWDVFAKAYVFEMRTANLENESAREFTMEGVARALLEREVGVQPDRPAIARTLQSVRDSWHATPPTADGES